MTPSLSGRPEVGKFYLVPCVRLLVPRDKQHPAAGLHGWIPTLGPEHHDREVIGFSAMHFHIDVRFLSNRIVEKASGYGARHLMGFPVSTWSDGVGRSALPHEKSVRRIKCHRRAEDFPVAQAVKWFAKMEAEHASCKLKPGNICPHRGIDLTPFVKDDGTVVCPGHGLRWDTRTGDLLPYQAQSR